MSKAGSPARPDGRPRRRDQDLDTDAVFRALADPSRRQMLDLLKETPGLSVGGLAESFPVTRYAVMKHLRVLEGAGLVVRRRQGRSTRLYLNAIPIQTIHDRWISRYSALWASTLTSLKYELEKEDETMAAPELKQVYVTYIRTTPDKLWQALTRPEYTRQYFHGTDVEVDLSVGGRLRYMTDNEDGERVAAVEGDILEIEPGKRLVHTFEFHGNGDRPSRVTWEIEPMGETVKLTVTHDDFDGETETYTSVRQGWPPVFSGLKTLLETGQPLKLAG